jgi:hypothetical protein
MGFALLSLSIHLHFVIVLLVSTTYTQLRYCQSHNEGDSCLFSVFFKLGENILII